MAEENSFLGNIKDRIFKSGGEMVMALGLVAVLAILFFPVPNTILDLALTFNISISIIVLLTALYTLKPLDFSIFPSLLLILTLVRLSTNVATTRVILSRGNEGPGAAGEVIQAFGYFVVQGDYLVGFIIFAILVIINFMVITKGSGRIAEVAARFTLDAMPGKQMAIDADLSAGLIQEEEAKTRRSEISREADFYGAMDGASKFVRGDAVASIITTAINLIGGLLIGVTKHGMDVATAAQNYTILTIGDGLVGQIPALLISTSAGIIVSRAGSEGTLSVDYATQFTRRPEALALAGSVVFIFGLLPGMPTLAFCLTGALICAGSYILIRRRKLEALVAAGGPRRAGAGGAAPAGAPLANSGGGGPAPPPAAGGGGSAPSTPEKVEALLPLDVLELEVGYGLIPLVDDEQGGELLERIRSIRRQFALESGFIVPPMHVRDNLQLRPGEYAIIIRGNEMARAEMMVGHQLAMNPGDATTNLPGIPTSEPAFGLPATWIAEDRKDEAQHSGWTVVDLATVIATHLTEIIRLYASDLVSRQDVQKLIDNVSVTNEKVVEELIPELLSIGQVQKVIQNLLTERVSVRDMPSILEVLADHANLTKDVDLLTEFVRQRLARTIIKPYLTANSELPMMTIGSDIEEALSKSINETERGAFMSLDPDTGQRILNAINSGITELTDQSFQPVVLCTPIIRRHLHKLTERFIPNLVVLSHSELTNNIQLKIIGEITFNYAQ